MKMDRKPKAAKDSPKIKPVSSTQRGTSKPSALINGKQSLSAYKHMPIGIVECSPDGRYIDFNEEFCRITGYTRNGLLRKGIRDLTHEDDYALDIKLHEQLVAGKIPFYRLEKRFVRKDGQVVWVELTRSVFRDKSGKPLYTVGVVLDISERKDSEKTLRESAERLRLATEAARMFTWEWDFQTKIYTVADSFVQVLGFSAGLLPKNTLETVERLAHPQDRQTVLEGVTNAIERRSDLHSLQCRLIDPENGQVVWLELNAKIVYDPEGKPERMFGVAQNITESKRTEELQRFSAENMRAAAEANVKFRTFFDQGSYFAGVMTPDGTVVEANRLCLDFCGFRREDVVGKKFWDCGWWNPSPELREMIRKGTAEAVAGTLFRAETTYFMADGSERYVDLIITPVKDETGSLLFLAPTGTDITERKQMENAIRASEKRFRDLVSQITAGITESDLENRLTFVNPRFCEMLGYTETELLGKTIWDLTYTEDLDENKRLFEQLLASGRSYQFEKRFICKDGSTLWTTVSASPKYDLSGRITGSVGVVVDIEERKKAERALAEFARQQEALYKLSDRLHRVDALANILDAALDAILSALPSDRASILLFDNKDVMRFVAWRGLSDAYRQATDGHSPWKPDVKNPEPISINDIAASDLEDTLKAVIEREGIGSLAFIPMVFNGKLIGKFMVYFNTPHTFDDAELDLSLAIARQLASSIERQRAENELRQSEERFRQAANAAGALIYEVDLLSDTSAAVHGLEQLTGYEPGEVAVSSEWWNSLIHPDDLPAHLIQLDKLIQSGRTDVREYRVQHKNNKWITVQDNRLVIRDATGQSIRLVGAVIDITGRKEAEAEKNQLLESEQAQRIIAEQSKAEAEQAKAKAEQELSERRLAEAALGMWIDSPLPHDARPPWLRYGVAFVVTAVAVLMRVLLDPLLGDFVPLITIFGAVAFSVWYGGAGPALFSMIFGYLGVAWFVINPHYVVTLDVESVLSLSLFLFSGGIVMSLGETMRRAQRHAHQSARVAVERQREVEFRLLEQQRIEGVLRASEERYRGMVNQTIGGIAETDLTGKFTMVNDHFCEITGYTRAELLNGTRMQDITHPDDLQTNVELFKHMITNGTSFEIEKRYICADGSTVWVHNSVSAITDVDGKPHSAVAIVIDVTERKRIEEALRLENARFMRFVDSNIVGIVIGEANGKLLLANDYYLQLLGVSRQDFNDEKVDWKTFTPPEWLPADEKALRELSERGVCEPYEKEYIRNDGRRVPVYIANAILPGPGNEIAAFVLDITDRKRMEEQLRAREAELEEVINRTPFMLTRCTRDLRYRFVSRAYAEMIGRTPEEVAGKPIVEIMGEEGVRTITPFIEKVLQGEYIEYESEVSFQGVGAPFLHVAYTPDRDEQGNVIGWFASLVDISERRRAEEQLRKSAEFDAFRVMLNDALRPLSDPQKILAEAMRLLGEKLQVDRVLYSEIEADDETIMILDNYVRAGVPRLTGRASLNDYGKARGLLDKGKNLIIEDATTSPDLDEKDRASFAATGIKSGIGIPLIKGGRWSATLGVHHSLARPWTENEIKFMKETAERTWSALEHARAQEKLRASETLYRTIAQNIPGGGVYVVDRDFRYLVAEGPVTEAFGLSREMLEGHTVAEVFPGESGKIMEDRLRQNFAGESTSFEIRYGGRYYWTRQAPLLDSIGQAIVVTMDITERKQAEEALRESEERFRAILRQATAGIIRKDTEGRFIYVNEAFCNLLGYTDSELLGKGFWEFTHAEDIEENRQLYDRLMTEGVPFKLEKRLIRRDGSIVWVDTSVSPIMDAEGKPQSAVAVEVDITGRKQAEEALQQLNLQLEERVLSRTTKLRQINQTLRQEITERIRVEEALRQSEAAALANEEKLRTLFDLLPVGISFLSPEGTIIQMNSALPNILKLPREELLSQAYKSRRYIRADGMPMLHPEFASTRALAENRTIYNVETGIILESGEVIWTSVSAAPVNVEDVGLVVVTMDITDSKRAEHALQESRERLQILSRRLVEVQEEERRALARELHDRVGQTLAALNINLIIINGQLSADVARQIGTRLSDSMKLVAETIKLVRDVMTDLRPAVLDDYGLEAALEAHLNQYTSRYDINAVFEKSEQPIPRLGSSIEMTFLRIAQEALMNVAKHSQANQVNVSLRQEENAICLTVHDNGMGIQSWQHANRPGSHGLTIMRERAEAFGGNLRVRSIPGGGTTVDVTIPFKSRPVKGEDEMEKPW